MNKLLISLIFLFSFTIFASSKTIETARQSDASIETLASNTIQIEIVKDENENKVSDKYCESDDDCAAENTCKDNECIKKSLILNIKADKQMYVIGEEIKLEACFKNPSEEFAVTYGLIPIIELENGESRLFLQNNEELIIKGIKGTALIPKNIIRWALEGATQSEFILDPGQESCFAFDISRYFDLKPDTYEIIFISKLEESAMELLDVQKQNVQKNPALLRKQYLISNTLKIEVKP